MFSTFAMSLFHGMMRTSDEAPVLHDEERGLFYLGETPAVTLFGPESRRAAEQIIENPNRILIEADLSFFHPERFPMSAVHAVVRLLADPENRVPEGGGMLVSPRHVVTCDHVFSKVENQGVVHLDFPYHSTIKPYRARRISIASEVDIALLEIVSKRMIPDTVAPVLFKHFVDQFLRADVEAYGFPDNFFNGDWAYGKLIGKTAEGFFQIDQNTDGKFVQPGFSGTAGWMDRQRRVIGMVAQRFMADGKCSVDLIPAKTLAEHCLKVGVHLQFAEVEKGAGEDAGRAAESHTSVAGDVRESAVVHGSGNTINLTVGGGLQQNVIDLSYYRINRRKQIESLGAFLKEPDGKPIILALDGHILECHDKFLECLCEFYWNAKIFPGGSKPKLFPVNWPVTDDPDEIRAEVGRELANQAGLPEDRAHPGMFNERTGHAPVVVFSCFSSSLLKNSDRQRKVFEGFRKFWSDWPARPRRSAPLFAILGIMYRSSESEKPKWWPFGRSTTNRINQRLRKNLPRFWSEEMLPGLEAVSLDDAIAWTRETDIRERCARSGRSISAEIEGVFDPKERMHMSELVEALAGKFPM